MTLPGIARELRPVGRYEWESIIMRARLTGVIGGNGKRGGVTGLTFKAIALVLASHADGVTGAQMFPGDATVAVLAETSLKTVKTVKAKLIELGLIDLVRAGARRAHGGNEYRLTMPVDILESLDVLTPAAVKAAAIREGEKTRGTRRGGSTGTRTQIPEQGPLDPSWNAMGVPPDPPQPVVSEIRGGTTGPHINGCGGTTGPSVGVPPDPHTNQDHPPLTNHPDEDLHTAVTQSRVTEPNQDQNSPSLPPRCDHGLRARRRPDGTSTCALCRLTATTTAALPATA